MKEINPAKVSVFCFLFLLILFFTASLDYAIAGSFVTAGIFFRLPSVWLFLCSFTFFTLFLLQNYLSLKLGFIGDFSVTSYFLFASALVLYLIRDKIKTWELKIPFRGKVFLHQSDIYKMSAIFLVLFLILPVIDPYLSAIGGYILFSLIFRRNEGRLAFSLALFFLVLCPFLLIGHKEKSAEISAIFTYYFLVTGVVQEIWDIIKNRSDYEEDEVILKDTSSGFVKIDLNHLR